jgi:hypothetical protein
LTAAPVVSACESGGAAGNIRFASSRENRENWVNKFKIHLQNNKDKFQILGTVESVGDSSFVVGGTTILIDISKTPNFKQIGSIDVGDNVIVKGIVIDGVNYAQKIVVTGEKGEILQFKIKGLSYAGTPTPTPTPSAIPSPTPEASPTASPSPSASPTASPSPEASPTVSPSPTASPIIVVDVRAKGPIEVVKEFLAQVLAYLEGLIS